MSVVRGALDLRNVSKRFTTPGGVEQVVLRGVSLSIAPREIVVILGASACGKSTLLRISAGLEAPTSGTVAIDGAVAGIGDGRTAVAFQEPRLLPWRSLAQNVALGLPDGRPVRRSSTVVTDLLRLVQLEGYADHRPREVSGGMAQRVALARALARSCLGAACMTSSPRQDRHETR
jgi:sulfonate transport system ATP-binding protein